MSFRCSGWWMILLLKPSCEEVLDVRRSPCCHMSGLLLVVRRIHQSHQLGSRAACLTLAVLMAICYRRTQMSVDTVSPDWGWAEGAAANVAWRRRMAAMQAVIYIWKIYVVMAVSSYYHVSQTDSAPLSSVPLEAKLAVVWFITLWLR